MKKVIYIIKITTFMFAIIALTALTFISEKTNIAFFENRTLAALPELNSEDFWSGKYFSSLDKYFLDNVFMRTSFLKLNTIIDMKVIGRENVNNNIITKKGAILPYRKDADFIFNEDKVDEMASRLETLSNYLKSRNIEFIYFGLPQQSSIFRDFYPDYMNNLNDFINKTKISFFDDLAKRKVDFVDMGEVFSDNPDFNREKMYYFTDHHYNLEGAYIVYSEMIDKVLEKGINADKLETDEFVFKTLPNAMIGSRNKQIYALSDVKETLLYHELNNPISFRRFNNGEEVYPTVYWLPSSPDAYAEYTIYMGGDIGETIIKTERPELPNVLIFGDSFTNAVEVFLYSSFNETRSLDFRKYTEKDLITYLEDCKDEFVPDIVICLRDDVSYTVLEGNGDFLRTEASIN